MMTKRFDELRLTVAALEYYVPIFQVGAEAEDRILSEELTTSELNALETQARLKDLAIDKIMTLSKPLVTSEINKMISSSHLSYSSDLFDILYYAGVAGITKGLRHFDKKKLRASATNYLFQWFTVYAKRELNVLESPFGIAPSRFQKYKKVSAVRKKLSDEWGYAPSNLEILEYFHSGQADLKTFNGRLGSSEKRSEANKSITFELIKEQEEFELNLMNVDMIDPLEDHSSNSRLSTNDELSFDESIFGAFIESYGINAKARVVLMSELGSSYITDNESDMVANLDLKEYRAIANAWKALIKDLRGPFYLFLKQVDTDNYSELDISRTISAIEEIEPKNTNKYEILFNKPQEQK